MSNSIPGAVVVLLCIIGAGAVVTVCAAFGKSMFSSKDEPEINFSQPSADQASYLRRVREMNQIALFNQVRSQRRDRRQQRDLEGSDVEIQSSLSYSNAGRLEGSKYSQHSGGYYNQGYVHHAPPVAYYEEHEYAGYAGSNPEYEERPVSQHQQQEQYNRNAPYGYQYVTTQAKPVPLHTWNEVQR